MRKPKDKLRSRKVYISEELFMEIQKYAEPLVDNFESACWKAIKAKDKAKGG